jgi:type I restriction enzyme S subunit
MTHESTIPHLPLEKLLRLPVLVPPPSEQSAVVSTMRSLTAQTNHEVRQRAKLRLLKQGLMEDLLTGRVRVTALLKEAAE